MHKIYRSFHLLIFLLFLFASFSYLFSGGFGPGDGIGDYLYVKNSNLNILENLKLRIIELKSYSRPVSIFLNILIYSIFKDNLFFYTFLSLLIWYLSIYLLYFCLKFFLQNHITKYFLLLGLFPFYSSSIFAEPYLLSSYHASIFFWSLSLYFYLKFSINYNIFFKFLSLLFFALSLLTLEIVLPLIILSILLPYCLRNSVEQKKSYFVFRNFLIFFLPIFFISFLFLVYKIFLIELLFSSEIYGYKNINFTSILQGVYYFFAIIVELPILLLKNIFFINLPKAIILFFLIYLINNYIFSLNKDMSVFKKIFSQKNINIFYFAVFASLILNSSIFIISFYPSVTYGFYNRMMICSFVVLIVIISIFLLNKKTILRKVLSFIILILFVNSAEIQFSNFAKSWNLRENIVYKIKNELIEIKKDKDIVLFANVPHYFKSNYNNESIFFTKWNLKSHLEFHGVRNLKETHLVSFRHLNDRTYNPSHNVMFDLDRFEKIKNFYYFEFEEGDENGKFLNFKDRNNMILFFQKKKLEDINNHPIILREKIRLAFKDLVKKIL
mgnify:CR=1 FL=1